MDGKINYGVYHEHVMDLYEFKQPEKLLSDLTDYSATDSESSNDERSFDDSFSDRSDTENETVDKNNNLNRSMSHLDEIFNEPYYMNRSMSHVDAILNETNNLNRSMSHVDAIFNDPISTCNTDEISVPILNHRKRPLDDDRTIRPYFEVNRDEKGKQIVGSDGRIKCTMCGGRYYEKGIKAHSISCKKKMNKNNNYFEPAQI